MVNLRFYLQGVLLCLQGLELDLYCFGPALDDRHIILPHGQTNLFRSPSCESLEMSKQRNQECPSHILSFLS